MCRRDWSHCLPRKAGWVRAGNFRVDFYECPLELIAITDDLYSQMLNNGSLCLRNRTNRCDCFF